MRVVLNAKEQDAISVATSWRYETKLITESTLNLASLILIDMFYFSALVRSKRDHIIKVKYELCSEYDHQKLETCLNKIGLPSGLKYDCRSGRIVCYYVVKCTHQGGNPYNNRFQCNKVSHYTVAFGGCCTMTC